MSQREILSISSGRATSDGAGVSLTRVFGGAAPERFDPFLMLDEFGSHDPDEYIAGFPPHPHRGFETITYMLEGRMRHEDHLGNVGLLESGGVQWMTAARGVIHSEMPQQQEGTMRGFQLWLNLPSHAKLGDPDYRDFAPAEIPQLALPGGVQAKVIAGVFKAGDIEQHGHRLLLYVYDGTLRVGEQAVSKGQLVQMSQEGELNLSSERGARLMLLAGRPLGEPIVQYGPFVMNSREEIEQALRDFRDGTFA